MYLYIYVFIYISMLMHCVITPRNDKLCTYAVSMLMHFNILSNTPLCLT